jgi:hypothetical protein
MYIFQITPRKDKDKDQNVLLVLVDDSENVDRATANNQEEAVLDVAVEVVALDAAVEVVALDAAVEVVALDVELSAAQL